MKENKFKGMEGLSTIMKMLCMVAGLIAVFSSWEATAMFWAASAIFHLAEVVELK